MADFIEPGARPPARPGALARRGAFTPPRLPPGPDGLSFALFQSTGVELLPGHRVDLIENGRIFDALVAEIRRARRTVHVLVHVWRPGSASDRVVEALRERARAGVRCRVVMGPLWAEHFAGELDRSIEAPLAEAGCEVRYHRLRAGRVLGRVLAQDHQKLVIVDGRVGLTGGFGIGSSWEGGGRREGEWRDTNVRVEGPAVRQLQIAFARTWQEAGGELLPPDAFPELPLVGPASATYVTSHGRLGVTDAERMYRLVIAAARKRLWIASAYFAPPDDLLSALETKNRQGVDVRILAAGPIHDVPLILASQRATYRRLLRAGVRIWEYQPALFHAKTVVADDWLAVVGSSNLDLLSLNRLGEGSLIVANPDFNEKLASSFERDIGYAREITHGHATPWHDLARRITAWLGRAR